MIDHCVIFERDRMCKEGIGVVGVQPVRAFVVSDAQEGQRYTKTAAVSEMQGKVESA